MISITISGLRIFATSGIFIFHLLGLYDKNNKGIDYISILIFCLLTGYLSYGKKSNSYEWLKKRFLSILIPYWIVIVPALIINRIVSYKNTSIFSDFITFLGGNLFLQTKVYVIAWYITFVLLLYCFIFFQSFFSHYFLKTLAWLAGFLVFYLIFDKSHYFISFGLGFFLASFLPPANKNPTENNSPIKFLFNLQDYCYGFFLIHGGVLIFLYNICKADFFSSFIFGVGLSIMGSIILNKIAKNLIIRATAPS
ncbi:MAG: hypothetical protein A2328_07030 [Bdellovibrionales bacterium RIFOXYB2_FULL_36_6]|nr:MAG: hypothetical protein A2328_07030 [Bdellovibrionales bacterium RIFOXYB2_FULL_36_6]